MGRKIPGKKHKGVKDPEKQRLKRMSELETKINAPPENPDEQTVPKSLEEFIKLKEGVKSGKIGKNKKKEKKKNSKLICVGNENFKPNHPQSKGDKVVPVFKQRRGESGDHFMNRVEVQTRDFIKETEFETKYNVQVERNPKTGKIVGMKKKSKDELNIERLRMSHNNVGKKAKGDTVRLTKTQKRREKLLLKRKRKEENELDDFKHFQDDVKFGEVVHAPPKLNVKPTKANVETNFKPGRKKLLLNSMMEQSTPGKNESPKLSVPRSGKRKNLPIGERRQLEEQQKEAVRAYRKLKSKTC